MTDRIGQHIGNYRLTRLLGSGGFAEVYLGQHLYLGTLAAIKLLHMRVAESEMTQFQQEGQMLANLDHSAAQPLLMARQYKPKCRRPRPFDLEP